MKLSWLALALAAGAQSSEEAPAGYVWAQQDEGLEFSYGWSDEAEATPVLRERLHRDLERAYARAGDQVEESRAAARANGFAFTPHFYEQYWQTAGLSDALLSLSAGIDTFSGGAHGNIGFAAILWDRRRDVPVETAELLGAALRRLERRYCDALDADRAERRGEPVRRGSGEMFSDCPPLREQVLVPADGDGNGRFDILRVLLAPYVAGPYVEGTYVVELSLDTTDLALIPLAYRTAFEAAPHAR